MTAIKQFSHTLVEATLIVSSYNQETTPKKNKVRLSFGNTNPFGRATVEVSTPNTALVTIKNSTNNVVEYNLEKMQLVSFNGGYITEEIELYKGEYTIEDFIVIDGQKEAIYLTPRQHTEFANLVSTPLPIHFTVAKTVTITTNLEVIPI